MKIEVGENRCMRLRGGGSFTRVFALAGGLLEVNVFERVLGAIKNNPCDAGVQVDASTILEISR